MNHEFGKKDFMQLFFFLNLLNPHHHHHKNSRWNYETVQTEFLQQVHVNSFSTLSPSLKMKKK